MEPTPHAEAFDGPDTPGSLRRACDQCRSRKIRCNKETPCSNCRIAERTCSSTGLGQKPREARQRVLISHQYERKIDHFEARLAGIETMLRNLTTSLTNSHHMPAAVPAGPLLTSPSTAASATLYEEPLSGDEDEDDEAFEGDSSMAAHTVFAREFVEQAVTSTELGTRLSPDIQNALQSLQQMVRMQNQKGSSRESRFDHQKPMPKGGVRELPLPPTDVVLQLLREIKETPPLTFALACAYIAIEDFVESCRKVYFAMEDYSIATFVMVTGGLYFLLQEKAAVNEARRDEFLTYHYMCRDNLETALANLPLLLTPRVDTIEATLLGASYAVEISKFTLAWQLNSAAVAMCQTLGWHRLSGATDEATIKKTSLFWFSYILDRGLAFRFGRAAQVADWEVTVPRRFGDVNMTDPWKMHINSWITVADVMGQVYEQLFSPGGLTQGPERRTECAKRLIRRVEETAAGTERRAAGLAATAGADGSGADTEFRNMTLDMMVRSDLVVYSVLLTMLQRAIPCSPESPSTFNHECIKVARAAFARHNDYMTMASDNAFLKAAYLHWTILYVPFVPFHVLFCHVIETSDAADLQRLAQFIDTLQPVISMSTAIEKLHKLCQVLYKVAALYVEAKAQQLRDQDMGMVGSDFEMYLSQLGFLNQPPPQAVEGAFEASEALASHSMQLEDWFSGNRTVMGLMEEDLSGFNPGLWSGTDGSQT